MAGGRNAGSTVERGRRPTDVRWLPTDMPRVNGASDESARGSTRLATKRWTVGSEAATRSQQHHRSFEILLP